MMIKVKFQKSNLNFLLTRHSDFSSFYQVYVERSYSHLMELIKKGDTIIDAGANIGIFTTISSILTGKSGLVIAIEPDPSNLAILRENVRINKLDNVIIIDKALFNKSDETLNFHQDGVMSRVVIDDKNSHNVISVRTITLDDIIDRYDIRPCAIKMDIEGAEFFALQKASNLMATLNYFEGEIHNQESELMLYRALTDFNFISSPAENFRQVKSFVFRHPLKTLRLEYSNHFVTTRRILKANKSDSQEFPKIIFGRKKQ